MSASIWTHAFRKVKYGFQASFSDTFISDALIRHRYSENLYFRYLFRHRYSENVKSVFNVAFSLKPFDLGPCVFPGYFGFGVLDFPGISYDNVAFTNPHSPFFRSRDPAHADNPVHTLKCYPFSAEQTRNRCQDFISVLTGGSYSGYFKVIA